MSSARAGRSESGLAWASPRDSLGLLASVFLPTVARGVIIRRPRVVAGAERLELDRRAVRTMQKLRDRYGDGPVLVRMPGRTQAVLLSPADVHRVLEGTPEPFAADSSEKRAALSHFEPHGVLISHGADRADRRRFNEDVLESECPRHRLAEGFVEIVYEEGALLLDCANHDGILTWDAFTHAWHRAVRRVVLGDFARQDDELTHLLARLRSDANWAFLHPRRRAVFARFTHRLERHLERAEPGSLAQMMSMIPTASSTDPAGQVPQWLFAFDAAGIATFRALALLSAHPEQARHAVSEIAGSASEPAPELPYLRACMLESVRLWPTTPMILRQSTMETEWDGETMPAGTGVLIFAPYFHRDATRLPFADRFTPEIWLQGSPEHELGIIPFSDGPARCPGREIVLLLGSTMLSTLARDGVPRLVPTNRLDEARPLPGTLDYNTLRFECVRRSGRPSPASRPSGRSDVQTGA